MPEYINSAGLRQKHLLPTPWEWRELPTELLADNCISGCYAAERVKVELNLNLQDKQHEGGQCTKL